MLPTLMSLVSERILSGTRLLSTVERFILGFYFVDEDIQNSVTVKTKMPHSSFFSLFKNISWAIVEFGT